MHKWYTFLHQRFSFQCQASIGWNLVINHFCYPFKASGVADVQRSPRVTQAENGIRVPSSNSGLDFWVNLALMSLRKAWMPLLSWVYGLNGRVNFKRTSKSQQGNGKQLIFTKCWDSSDIIKMKAAVKVEESLHLEGTEFFLIKV